MIAPPRARGPLDVPGPTLPEHLAAWGPLPSVDAVAVAHAVGLSGRGGAGFPTAVKLRSVVDAAARSGRQPVVVANGAEGEPAAAKDKTLLLRAPHLVLDGLDLVATTLGTSTAFLAADALVLPPLRRHLEERRGGRHVTLHPASPRFLSGEESALVAALDGGASLPRAKEPPVRERGVGGRPTLVLNVETLARLALAARGDLTAASRMLVTRRGQRGGTASVDVLDVAPAQRLGDLLAVDADVRAVLVGGYHGTWLPVGTANVVDVSPEGLSVVGASLGAGVVAALPADRCGLAETARVVGYLARESAGQCGPCLNGLPRIAAALGILARPAAPPHTLLGDLERWCGLVVGRGACRHPDGSVRLVASALTVFRDELTAHRQGWCTATSTQPFLPVPGHPS
jgi:NADH:ubiquinone oxidoreductase subunit F (NADH-binding)